MASAATSEEPSAQHASGNDNEMVAESLLSFAKDIRYVGQCSHLVREAMESIMPRSTARPRLSKDQTSWFLSSVLYILLVVLPSGRSLGMEACGLKFTSARRQVIASMLTSTVGWYALDYFISKEASADLGQDREDLRGTDRLNMHQRLRNQMLQRARSEQPDESESARSTSQNATNAGSNQSLRKRIATLLSRAMKSATQALNQPDGPHSLENQREGTISRISVLTWILRLHLAHFCFTGKYPSILHRMLRLDQSSDSNAMKPIIFRPRTNRVVALLIGLQASATFARCVLKWSAKRFAEYLESRQAGSSTRTLASPLAAFKYPHTDHPRKKFKSISNTVCGICRLERNYPAAPISCGHIFCWSCLYQWVATVQKACPLCRSPCRTQDILPLCKYEQHFTP